LADAIVAEISAGAGLAEAARGCGVGERTLRRWRRRAWSTRSADRDYVDLEKRIQRALATSTTVEESPPSWEEAAAALEREHPERWAVPELGDVLAELN
jgi:transposase-like protein